VVEAFRTDPAFRYFFPDDASYPALAGSFAGHLFDRRVRRRSVWVVAGGASVSMWEPPAGPADVKLEQSAGPDLPVDAAARLRRYDEAVHPLLPDEPHWYLGVLATHPDHAGQRWGRAVMAAGLEQAAAAGQPAFLETTNPSNVAMYTRGNWVVAGSVAVDGLQVWVMRHPDGVSGP
jgi:ribosomal protein S18 acetylase RimI-like enzyme